ncbi:MAG: hypothetical protein DMG05_10855 [Acidobacteria bacterium]|nr:MAG: hypothetical protein DMG05_10855 [Acidobacteriota bacterium]
MSDFGPDGKRETPQRDRDYGMPSWDADLYLKFANERTQPAVDRFRRLCRMNESLVLVAFYKAPPSSPPLPRGNLAIGYLWHRKNAVDPHPSLRATLSHQEREGNG